MTEITLNSKTPSLVKVLIATKEEQLNYGVTGGIIDRSTFNKLKALVERNDENCDDKDEITILDTIKDVVVLLRTSNNSTTNDIETLAGKLYQRIKNYKSATVYARHLPKTDFSTNDVVNAIGLGIEMSSYSFDKYQTQKKANEYPQLETINFVAKEKIDPKAYNNTKALANAIRYARDLTNEPANELTPEIYAKDIKRLENLGLKITLLDEAELKKKGFNMLLSVSQGSINKPYVAILEYIGNKKKKGYDVALVGKGVTSSFTSTGFHISVSEAITASAFSLGGKPKASLKVSGSVGATGNASSTWNGPSGISATGSSIGGGGKEKSSSSSKGRGIGFSEGFSSAKEAVKSSFTCSFGSASFVSSET